MTGKSRIASVAAGLVLLSIAATSLFVPAKGPSSGVTPTADAPATWQSLLYVADGAEGRVSVINTTSSSVLWQIDVRANVREAVLDNSSYGSFVYFTDVSGNNFITLTAQTGEVYGTYPSGAGTLSVVEYPPGGYVYVIASKDHSVSVADSRDHKELNRDFLHEGTFHIGQEPLYAAFTPDLRFWYTDANATAVGVVRVNVTVVAIAPWVVDANVTALAQIPMPSTPGHIAVADGGREVLVGVQNGLIVINASSYKEISEVKLPGTPAGILASPNGGYIFAAGPSGVYAIDAENLSLVDTIPMAGGAYGLAISPDGGRLYVSNPSAGTVTVVDTGSLDIVGTIAVGGTPMGVSLYVGEGGSK